MRFVGTVTGVSGFSLVLPRRADASLCYVRGKFGQNYF
jgi:hypothetical protein